MITGFDLNIVLPLWSTIPPILPASSKIEFTTTKRSISTLASNGIESPSKDNPIDALTKMTVGMPYDPLEQEHFVSKNKVITI